MRAGGFRNVGGLAQRLTSAMAKGRGASIARLRVDWAAVVGPELARTTRPEALVAGRGGHKSGGRAGAKVLRLRVSGAAALEVQHMSGQLVERVNAYAGYRMIDDIRLTQGVIVQPPTAPMLPAVNPEIAARVAGKVAEVKDPELRQALARLGARIAVGRRSAVIGALGALAFAREPRAQENLLGLLAGDHALGKPDAPNVIVDYFSLTCPHCANFNAAVMPVLRREAIDTGKLLLIMRHYPSDSVATHAAQVAEGAGADRFFATIDVLFRTQFDWLTSPTPEVELVKGLGELGITPEAATAFMSDDRLLDKIVADVQTGQALKVRATPSLFINGRFEGGPPGGEAGAVAILRLLDR